MITVPLEILGRYKVPADVLARMKSFAASADDTALTFDPAAEGWQRYGKAIMSYGIKGPVVEPVAIAKPDWPHWAASVADMREAGDVGVGSTIRRLTDAGNVAVKALLAMAKVECRCDTRAAALDKKYPY